MTDITNPHNVKVGQIWADNDKRLNGRRIKVLEVGDTHATVASPTGIGPHTKIRLTRFRPISTGYRLLEDVADEATSGLPAPDNTTAATDDENGYNTWFLGAGGITVFDDGEVSIEVPRNHGQITAEDLHMWAAKLSAAAVFVDAKRSRS